MREIRHLVEYQTCLWDTVLTLEPLENIVRACVGHQGDLGPILGLSDSLIKNNLRMDLNGKLYSCARILKEKPSG